jgi:hypothetical protein
MALEQGPQGTLSPEHCLRVERGSSQIVGPAAEACANVSWRRAVEDATMIYAALVFTHARAARGKPNWRRR